MGVWKFFFKKNILEFYIQISGLVLNYLFITG